MLLILKISNVNFAASSRKRLVLGAVPSLELAIKSVPAAPVKTRREIVRHELGKPVVYHNLASSKKQFLGVKITGWSKIENEDGVNFEFWNPTFSLPQLSCLVNSGLNYSIVMHQWFLPDDHPIYTEFARSLKHTTISTILSQLETYEICEDIDQNELTLSKCEDPNPTVENPGPTSSGVIRHTVPLKLEHYDDDGPSFQARTFLRAPDCKLVSNSEIRASDQY